MSEEKKYGFFFRMAHSTQLHETSVWVDEDTTLPEVVDAFRGFLFACRFQEANITKALGREEDG